MSEKGKVLPLPRIVKRLSSDLSIKPSKVRLSSSLSEISLSLLIDEILEYGIFIFPAKLV